MPNILEYNELKEILPHAYPFLMIDRVIEVKKGESLTAIKNITANEWCCNGAESGAWPSVPAVSNSAGEGRAHLSQSHIFPEVLLIEAAAQAALVLYDISKIALGEKKPKYILGQARAEFKSPVQIGDQVRFEAKGNKMLYTGGYSEISLFTNNQSRAEIEIFYSVLRF